MSKVPEPQQIDLHFVSSVLEKIFSIGTSCFLHHAAVILPTHTLSMSRAWDSGSCLPRIQVVDLTVVRKSHEYTRTL